MKGRDTVITWRAGIVLTVTAIAMAGVFSGCARGEDQAAPAGGSAVVGDPQRIEVDYSQGAVAGGVRRIPVQVGSMVRLVVASDVADEVHVHGYDLKADVAAGATATVEFRADQRGVFEVELEDRSSPLAQLEVR